MSYNLLVDPLAPFLTESGEVRWLSIPDIVAGLPDGDYAIEPAWSRADLDTATYELAIGILSLAFAPQHIEEWDERYSSPPTPDELRAAIAPLVPFFDVDGEGPLFMQERGLEGDANPVEALFIDTPGANAQKKNSDLLTHRGRYGALCMPAAAIALYALQSCAPAGGAGIRTSMRGGGPLTALVVPEGEPGGAPVPFWHRLWANVRLRACKAPAVETVLLWLRSDLPVGREAGAGEIHASAPGFDEDLHPFFGMPRRIRLVVSEELGSCDLTGQEGPMVTGFVQKPYGLNYGLWMHPLTPYRRQKEDAPPYSVKPKSGRSGYRDWVAVTVGDGRGRLESLSLPAGNVQFARGEASRTLSNDFRRPEARIRVAGWAMNNMEAISYLVAEQPLPLTDPALAWAMDNLARGMAEAGDLANAALRYGVRAALHVEGDKGVVEQARLDFYARTDDAFHDLLGAAVKAGAIDFEATGRQWLSRLRRSALTIFDETCPVRIEDAEKAEAVVQARANLISALAGHGKMGAALFGSLGLPLPAKRAKREEEPA